MKRTTIMSSAAPALCLLLALSPVLAQRHDRLTAPLGPGTFASLHGSRDPRIDTLADEGALAATERLGGLGFRFRPSAEQSEKLERLLADQQDPSSPRYRSWLTPEQYADQFGLSQNDLTRVSQWLESQGFHVESTARTRTWITFSGTAEQVRGAFKAEIHRFRAHGQTRFANIVEAQVPAPLEPLIYNVNGLSDLSAAASQQLKPRMTFDDGSHGLSPGDLATIYNARPLLDKGFDGSGQKIAVVGASAINLSDVQQFRDYFELPANDPQLILAPGVPDPGKTGFYEEAVSDVEIAGASAPKASVLYVYSSSPFLAAQYAVDQNLAPVLTYTFATCEKIWTRSDVAAARAVVQQANAQGMTWLASSGDTGAAGCETQFRDSAGISGPWVTVPAVFPEVTAVGGTAFVEGGGDYWSSDLEHWANARSYIPEAAWNATALGQGLSASGGGASLIFPMPAWQNAPGVPKINSRLVPDISFAAAWDHDPYLTIAHGDLLAMGGTSSSAPFFAGVLSILNQYLASTGVQTGPGLGNINPRLYELARTAPDVFHDVTAGDNIVPCKPGSTDCVLDRYGYSATPGYDPATGLGSLDVEKFVLNWTPASSSGTTSTFVTITASPETVDAGASTTLTATVKGTTGAAVPPGTVSFRAGQRTLADVNLSDSGGSAVAQLTVDAGQLAAGLNTITAQYGGASIFSPSTGTAEVIVTGGAALIAVSADPAVVYKQTPDADGYAWHYRIQLADGGGVPSVITQFSIDQTDYSDRISSMFVSPRIPAYGSLTAALRAKITSTPVDHTYSFGGIDTAGNTWSRQITIRFLSERGSAAMSLSSSPSTVRHSPQADPRCTPDHPLYHQLNLQELNGIAVLLDKFIANGKDLSSQIGDLFGSTRLQAFGVLRAGVCWTTGAFPVDRSFEVSGEDAKGQTVKATVQVTFKDGVNNPGPLAVSKKSVELSAASGTAETIISVNLPATEQWSVSVLPANQKTRWLAVSPTSGRGPAQVRVIATATGLATGGYTATLVFQSDKTVPQEVNVPVVFVVGNPGEGQ
jgi:hypothetical protein